jgi:hypothetical protein
LNVVDAPFARVALDHVKMHWFDRVDADGPLPFKGPSVAPDGTESFVQCAPLGTLNWTA